MRRIVSSLFNVLLTTLLMMTYSVPASAATPVISGTPSTSGIVNTTYQFQPSAKDSDNDPLRFFIRNKPAWATFSSSTGLLSGKPTFIGTYSNITIGVTDGRTYVRLPTFSITVKGSSTTNSAPVISGTPGTGVIVGTQYRFQPAAWDANGDKLAFSITNKPIWASFSTSTGLLTGTPTVAGNFYNIVISVSDGKASRSLPAFGIQAVASSSSSSSSGVNSSPVISGTPGTGVIVGTKYRFQPTASDANGDKLTFSITNKPSWASFSTSSGLLTGTPTLAGNFYNIVISVSDGKVSRSLPAFGIQVVSASSSSSSSSSSTSSSSSSASSNSAPRISGTPSSSVTVGNAYSFTPTASDADNDALGFSISNKPSWATFSTTNGKLSGTPTSANVGSYTGISISVSDGKVSTALPNFSISVNGAATTGNVTLSWNAPTTNTDGTALTDLAGYKIYYGSSSSNLSSSVSVGVGQNTYVISNLNTGTWYFAITSVNSAGAESTRTGVVSKTI